MKKLYFLFLALFTAFAVSAETLTVEVGKWDDDAEDDEWGDDIEVEATINNGVVTIANFLSSGKTINFTCKDDGTAAHDWGTGWVNGSSNFVLSTFGGYNYVYLYGNEGDYVDAEYYDDEDGKYIYFGAYFYTSAWEWYDIYIMLPTDFEPASSAEAAPTVTLEIGKYDDDTEEDEWADDVEAEASFSNGVVTIPNFLSSGKSISITCYDDGSAAHNWGSGWVQGSSNFVLGSFGEYNYVYLYGNEGDYVDAEYYDDEDGKYIYFGAYFYTSAWEWFDIYIMLPTDFEPAVYVEPAEPVVYEGTATAQVYLRDGDSVSGDPISVDLGYKLSDNQLQITDAFGRTDISAYLSYTLNEDGSVTAAYGQGDDKYYTGVGRYTISGTSYDRLYDRAGSYDKENNTYIWDVSFGLSSDSYATLTDFRVILPLPAEFGSVNSILADSDENAPVEYFNLQGIRVANPENGLFIRRQGKTATKVILK